MVELGRVDINTKVSILVSRLSLPREEHLDAVFHIYSYIRVNNNLILLLDPNYPDIDESKFFECDWKEFYVDATEEISPNALEPRGKESNLQIFFDNDHAGNKKNQRSRTDFLIFMNMKLIQWVYNKQPMIDTSVFGAKFFAMKHGV